MGIYGFIGAVAVIPRAASGNTAKKINDNVHRCRTSLSLEILRIDDFNFVVYQKKNNKKKFHQLDHHLTAGRGRFNFLSFPLSLSPSPLPLSTFEEEFLSFEFFEKYQKMCKTE